MENSPVRNMKGLDQSILWIYLFYRLLAVFLAATVSILQWEFSFPDLHDFYKRTSNGS